MDNATKEKLEQLIDRATNPSTGDLEVAAMDAFCYAVRNDPTISTLATKLLAERIQSTNKKEALNALELLEESVARCGDDFRGKVNTFRFLNELIKLVSRKYNGDTTDKEVKDRILDLMLLWTKQYPEEKKVQESYNMLLKQGIVHEPKQDIKLNSAPAKPAAKSSKPPEDPTTVRFRQLLCSNNPADLQAAQIMMVNMVREEEKKILRVKELERGKSNVELLNEMIDQFDCDSTSMDDWSLIRDLFENCKEVQPTILLLAQDQNQTEQVICDALETNDRLNQVMEKFNTLVMKKAPEAGQERRSVPKENNLDSLIDLPAAAGGASAAPKETKPQDDMNELSDIFSSIQTNSSASIPSVFDDVDILKPSPVTEKPEDLLLPDIALPTNRQTPKAESKPPGKPSIDIDSLVNEMLKTSQSSPAKIPEKQTNALDGITVDIDKLVPDEKKEPRVVLDQPKGLRVLLNFTHTHPKPNVAVIVATIANQSTENISDIHFGATINPEMASSGAHVKLQEPSGTSLAGVKPFRSAVEDITQVILIENPSRDDLSLLCTVKYAPNFHQSITVEHLSNLLD
ncbi:ADP-ribosylation factor-binding protein GGA1 [Lutzomyia longipalpis]|uniref:ADP-ribosylation factor-binding protein GGA1 n=1 Tax=Lutzomyia longipalpis TaxID=7200 RepID=UPI0024838205|nr:ADP-ribosylation factor-binding protein GGA1 [Lutzomyia longipalpis]